MFFKNVCFRSILCNEDVTVIYILSQSHITAVMHLVEYGML